MTLAEHMRRADHAYDKLTARGWPTCPVLRTSLKVDALRFAPLFPLAEARRGPLPTLPPKGDAQP